MRGSDLLLHCTGRHNAIKSEAAKALAEQALAVYEHKQCGRKLMNSNSVYVGSSSLLKQAYINCTCIYEVCCSTPSAEPSC